MVAMDDQNVDLKKKGFHWNPLIGVMYGNIPVGLIIAVVVLLVVYGSH
jgi:hypothetical protein